jgi:hypothetical protein
MFDFYDDWDANSTEDDIAGFGAPEESSNVSRGGFLNWDNDELDRLLAGSGAMSGAVSTQPITGGRSMNYGTGSFAGRITGAAGTGSKKKKKKRKSTGTTEADTDPNVIPASTAFGFLINMPWNMGRKALRYKPSAADLQDNLSSRKGNRDLGETSTTLAGDEEDRPEVVARLSTQDENRPLLDDNDYDDDDAHDEDIEAQFYSQHPYDPVRASARRKKRGRSNTTGTTGTTGSESNSDSLRSRGDLFPSEDEDDAVPLDEEFSMLRVDTRESMGSGSRNPSNEDVRVQRSGKRPSGSRKASSRSMGGSKKNSETQLAAPVTSTTSAASVTPDIDEADELAEQEDTKADEAPISTVPSPLQSSSNGLHIKKRAERKERSLSASRSREIAEETGQEREEQNQANHDESAAD